MSEGIYNLNFSEVLTKCEENPHAPLSAVKKEKDCLLANHAIFLHLYIEKYEKGNETLHIGIKFIRQ